MKKISFNENWLCSLNGAESSPLTLPHDASQSFGRAPDAPSGTGGAFYLGGVCEYTKTFTVEDPSESLILEVEGAYPLAEIFLNGQSLGKCAYGYRGYFFDLSPLQAKNSLTIRVDDTARPNSRWYSGSGLYRGVNLYSGNKNHIHPEGIRVTTLSIDPAEIEVTADLTGSGEIRISILKDGAEIASASGQNARIKIPDAKLWSAETPELYTCRVTLTDENGTVLDEAETPFGIRKLTWSPEGFFINGQSVKFKGGCVHHDHGVIGAMTFLESEYRRIARLKEFGFNAVRSAHHPASKALLQACDELGMYVMDETWDMWYQHKTPYDYASRFEQNWQSDALALIAKDYNHPSVVMYSIGNEVTEPAEERGMALAREIADLFRASDPTRPTTAGINITLVAMQKMGINMTEMNDEAAKERSKNVSSTDFNEMASANADRMNQTAASDQADALTADLFAALDIAGYNYASSRYPIEGEKHPERLVVGSETYAWALPDNWAMVEKYPYLIGDFMWTAWDYIGENGIGAWSWEEDSSSFFKGYPWTLADSGALDILGHDNGEAGQAAVLWNAADIWVGAVPPNHPNQSLSKAMWRGSNALPRWSYRGCDGNPAQVEVYGRGALASLSLNGKDLGTQPLSKCKAVFDLPYESGTLTARILDESGNVLAEKSLVSATGEPQVCLTAEAPRTDENIVYVAVDLVGENGEIECNADRALTVRVEGGELLGFGSANPKTPEFFRSGTYTTWYGRALAVVRKTAETTTLNVENRLISF